MIHYYVLHFGSLNVYNPYIFISQNKRYRTLKAKSCCDEASVLVPSLHYVWVGLLCLRAVFIAVSQPGMNPSSHCLRPAHPPGDSVSTWTSVWDWHLQMLLTVVELRGSSSHSKVQMFLFSFPCFGYIFFTTWQKRRFSFMNYRNQICVPPLCSECWNTCLVCIDFGILSVKDLVLWGTPVLLWLQLGQSKKKSLKTQTYTCTATCTTSRWLMTLDLVHSWV